MIWMIKKNRSAQIFEYEWPKMTFDWGVQAKVDVASYIIQLYIKMYYIKSTFTFMHLADAFIQSDLFRLYIFCQYMCSLGIEPTTFVLLTQCSTTEPQEHCINNS